MVKRPGPSPLRLTHPAQALILLSFLERLKLGKLALIQKGLGAAADAFVGGFDLFVLRVETGLQSLDLAPIALGARIFLDKNSPDLFLLARLERRTDPGQPPEK